MNNQEQEVHHHDQKENHDHQNSNDDWLISGLKTFVKGNGIDFFGSWQNILQFMNVFEFYSCLSTLEGHTNKVCSVCVSGDNNYIISDLINLSNHHLSILFSLCLPSSLCLT